MYACCGGYEHIVHNLLCAGANTEIFNENGHTPLMEAASGGHVSCAKLLVHHGAEINCASNEFKESALTLACYKERCYKIKESFKENMKKSSAQN
jgi:ankyrin repeat domain-containing protein 17